MKDQNIRTNTHGLPEMFRPLLWSYVFEDIDPNKHYGELSVNTINYGSLKHWKWLLDYYGKDRMQEILENRWETEFNSESRHLARLIFGVDHFRHAPRGAH